MKKSRIFSGIVLLAIMALFASSCERMPKYVGTWEDESTMSIGEQTFTVNETVTLTETTFETTSKMITGGTSTYLFGFRGDLTATGNELTIVLNAVGFANQAGTLEWIDDEDAEWVEALAQSDFDETMTVTWVVVDDVLTITPEGEDPQIYTKVVE